MSKVQVPACSNPSISAAQNIRTCNFNRFIHCSFASEATQYRQGIFVTGPSWFDQERFLKYYNMKVIDCDTEVHSSGKIILYTDDIYNDCLVKSDIDFINIILSRHPKSKITFQPHTESVSIQII